ncbi:MULTISPECIES: hypothetical protein [unclassified Pseudofrankia]|uniref:hypothetical protein n=1 Tax=unclassified Pseudofrankia TaxID=2994372 RepID=UPI0008DA7FE8|nr:MULTISPECIES: hypothetical protein [unclassified Pseudofrankia]MDT3442705.1 hypothetical protein [Pseudofrankia sp. BMG5.37]OHV44282.1 hypothetical protein BCD48_25665 [Pseudofrankia sp. BMG5.36]
MIVTTVGAGDGPPLTAADLLRERTAPRGARVPPGRAAGTDEPPRGLAGLLSAHKAPRRVAPSAGGAVPTTPSREIYMPARRELSHAVG